MHSEFYKRYLSSPAWKEKRELALKKANHTCMRCRLPKSWCGPLEVHHLTYDNLGHERPEDLLVVCLRCHKLEDQERVQRSDAQHHQNALATYAETKYGLRDGDEISEEMEDDFEDWVERKQLEDNGY